jgi:hypothetical protein
MKPVERKLSQATATAILGIDTLWGGDVLNPSGTGRFIADSWFSDQPLPKAYRHPAAARLRKNGGVAGKQIDVAAVEAYLKAVDIPAAIGDLKEMAGVVGGLRGAYLQGLCECLGVMWDLVQERLGRGPAVPYERCVVASTGAAPTPSDPVSKRERVAELLAKQGYRSGSAWCRRSRSPCWPMPALRSSMRAPRSTSRLTCPGPCEACRARTSSSSRSRTPGFPGP